MKALVSKRSIFIAAVAVILAITTLVSVNVFGSDGPVTGAANAVSAPLRAVATRVVRMFENIYGSIYRYHYLVEEVERLHSINYELRQQYRDAAEISAENAYLRELLNLRDRLPGMQFEPAVIIGPGSSNFTSTFVINRGSDHNVKVGDSVITAYGMLIGRVTSVSSNTATVLTVLDTRFSASALVGDGGDTATARGDFNYMRQGFLVLDHLDDDAAVVPGDAVVTSGGALFPVGLIIGEVVSVNDLPTGLGRYAVVRPLLPLETISQINVVVEFDISG